MDCDKQNKEKPFQFPVPLILKIGGTFYNILFGLKIHKRIAGTAPSFATYLEDSLFYKGKNISIGRILGAFGNFGPLGAC